MSQAGSIWIEAIMLPFLFVMAIFLSSRFAIKTAMNRRFLYLVLSTFLANLFEIIEFLFPDLIPISIVYAVMMINGYCLMRYVAAYVRIQNEMFSRLHMALFFIALMMAFLVHKGLQIGVIMCYVFTIFFVIEGFCLQLIFQEYYGNGQFITMNFLLMLLIDAFLIEYVFKEPMPIYAVATAILVFTFFYIEAPTYRQLITAQSDTMAARIATEASIKRANTAAKAKSNFLASTSHEIRTPMNAILGMNEMILKESKGDKETCNAANNIKNAGNLLLSIINNILDISKIESGKMDLYNSEYHLYPLLLNAQENVSLMVKNKNLKFEINIDKDMPEFLNGDELRLGQIIFNLVDNAVKYTQKGFVKINVSSQELDASKIMLKISVEDSGIGIKPEDIKMLYTPFERVHFKETQNISGAGLGLTLVKYIVDLMGGTIDVKSTYGEGSTFSVEIPQKLCNEKITVQEYIDSIAESQHDESPTIFPDAKILVVDDTQVNLAVAKGMLKDSQAEVDTAISGEEALNLIEDKKYDIVFLDHRMPGMDGVETLNSAKTHIKKSKLPIFIALTADAGSGAREKYIALGFDDYLAKPFKPGEMINILRKFLTKK